MTEGLEPKVSEKRPSVRQGRLRFRMISSFVLIALLPFLLSMTLVFHLSRADMQMVMEISMQQEARLLADRVMTSLDHSGQWAEALGDLDAVRNFMAGEAERPESTLNVVKRLGPGIKEVRFIRNGTEVPHAGRFTWGEGDSLEYVVGLSSISGKKLGSVVVGFDLEEVREIVGGFKRGEEGFAAVFTRSGKLLATARVDALPDDLFAKDWGGVVTYEAAGETFFASLASVDPGGKGAASDLRIAIVQPDIELFSPFYKAAKQVALLLTILAVVVLALAWRMADRFLTPIYAIRHGAEIISSRTNPDYRIDIKTGDELEELAGGFNRVATSFATVQEELSVKVDEMTRSVQGERNRLASLLRTMVEGVIATDKKGEVALMNPRARLALGVDAAGGVGVNLSACLPRERLDFHMRRLRKAWNEGNIAVENVIFPLPGGKLLKGLISVIGAQGKTLGGFLLVFRDVSAEVAQEGEFEGQLKDMPETLGRPLATIHSVVEILESYPNMDEKKRAGFLVAIREEAVRSVNILKNLQDNSFALATRRWPPLPADPAELVTEAFHQTEGVFADIDMDSSDAPMVLVEPFSWVASLASVITWIAGESSGLHPVKVSLATEDEVVVVTLRVKDPPRGGQQILDTLQVSPEGEEPLSLINAVRANRGGIWTREVEEGYEVRMALPRASKLPASSMVSGILDDQPEFYDFDIFARSSVEKSTHILERKLDDLEYVVFDSETTGLNPSKGDRIVSLSAVRVRNNRIVKGGAFHELVNPEMPIPPVSTTIHGIDDEMVKDSPTIGMVLQKFKSYIGDAVLVAHNAAFDKKFLDTAAHDFEVPPLENPILDTLFLSYGLHGELEGHNIEEISKRLGIEVEGRHTSLGDARTTAEIFISLMPLIRKRGIVNLGQAKSFCDKMLVLRWQSSRF